MSGRVYQVDGVKSSLDKPFADSWTDFLLLELEREELWLHERQRKFHSFCVLAVELRGRLVGIS
jgi:hypothetical protein